MRECPGHHVVYGHGDNRTVHCPQCPAHDCRESGCGPGCSSSQGDRLSGEVQVAIERCRDAVEKLYTFAPYGYGEEISALHNCLPIILNALAPRPGGSEG